jgi:hypothetical protein
MTLNMTTVFRTALRAILRMLSATMPLSSNYRGRAASR